eukprot:523884-Amphidinium_carterae.1
MSVRGAFFVLDLHPHILRSFLELAWQLVSIELTAVVADAKGMLHGALHVECSKDRHGREI